MRTHHGLTLAAAGIDGIQRRGRDRDLPCRPTRTHRPQRSARALAALTGVRVAVVISDTAGRAWRIGQTDIAIGCAGLLPLESFAGRDDPYGNPLAVTAPAVRGRGRRWRASWPPASSADARWSSCAACRSGVAHRRRRARRRGADP